MQGFLLFKPRRREGARGTKSYTIIKQVFFCDESSKLPASLCSSVNNSGDSVVQQTSTRLKTQSLFLVAA